MNARSRHIVCGAALIVGAYVLIRTAWLCDDAFITFRTVENVISGIGMRWNPAERVQVFTHALWFFSVSAVRAVTGELYLTVLGLSMALTLATVALLLWRVAASVPMAVFAAVALLGSRAFVDYSTSGLENPLTHLLLVAFVLVWGRSPNAGTTKRLAWLSLLAALLLTNRLDTGLLVLPAVAIEAWRLRGRAIAPVVLGMIPFAVWEAFSIVYYGFPLPNTVYAKLPPNVSSADLWPHGLMYLTDSWHQDPMVLPVIVAAAVATMLVQRRDLPFALGLILSVLFTVRVGGDFMSGRFFAAPFVMAVALLSRYPVFEGRLMAWTPAAVALGLGVFCPLPPILSTSAYDGRYEPPSGITDERRYYFQNSGLIRKTGFSTGIVTRREANVKRVIDRGETVAVTISVGFDGYYAKQQLHIIDSAGLADPLMARLPTKVPWRVGHYLRTTPPGYAATLETGANVIEDPGVAAYYDRLVLITRGPIWSVDRWAAIVNVNLGRAAYFLDSYARGFIGVRASGALGYRPADSAQDANAAMAFDAGVTLFLDRPQAMRKVEFRLDSAHDYKVVYLSKGRERHTADIVASPVPEAGFVEYQQALPDSAGEIDQIRIVPRRGSGPGRLAYWRVID